MSEKLKESLSAVIDGEADEFELRRVLDEVAKDPQLGLSWDRYHLIGSIVRGERVARFHSMRETIWSEVQADTDTVTQPVLVGERGVETETGKPSAYRRWVPVAVAASVAIAVVVGFVDLNDFTGEAVPAAIAQSQPTVEDQQRSLNQVVALKSEVTRNDQVRTDAYKIYHMQQLGMNQSGFGGFTRMVSYERD